MATIDTDTVILEDLEHDIPCDALRYMLGPQCTEPAAWILVMGPHCPDDDAVTFLICQRHKDMVVETAQGVCTICDILIDNVHDYILRLEPLNRNGETP